MSDLVQIQGLVDRYFPLLAVWGLLAMRFFGFSVIFPLFSWVNLTTTVRAAFAAAMAAPLAYLEFVDGRLAKALTAVDFFTLSSKELFIGALIGLIAGIPFWAAQSCGELIDTYRGSSAGALFDPSITTETSELGAGLILFALAALVWSGGFYQLAGAIYISYQIWPVDSLLPGLKLEGALLVGGIGATYLFAALATASTLLLCLFAFDLTLALFGRSTRQIQIFDISMVVKNLGLALLLPLVGGALGALIIRDVTRGSFTIEHLRLLLE